MKTTDRKSILIKKTAAGGITETAGLCVHMNAGGRLIIGEGGDLPSIP